MKNFLWVLRLRMLLWEKHPIRLFFVVAIPFISIFIYFSSYQDSAAYTDNVSFGVVNHDRGTYTKALEFFLSGNVKLKSYSSSRAATDGLINNDVNTVVYLKKGSNEGLRKLRPTNISIRSLQGKLLEKQSKTLVATAIANVARLQRASLKDRVFQRNMRTLYTKRITIDQRDTNSQANKNMLTTQIIGFLMMMMLYSITSFASDVIQDERINHVYDRLLTTPLTQNEYLWGTAVTAFFIGTFETGLTMMLMKYFFMINAGISYLKLFGILELFALMAVIVSLLIGLAVNRKGTGDALQTLLYTLTSLLSGTVIPLSVMPTFMQQLAKFMPQYWVVETISSVQKLKEPQLILMNLAILAVFVIFFFCATLFVAKRKKKIQFI
ncbi:ABC transporter permease [Liquorilactobacillus satsumensis]|uniref:ABC transporter permease n=1 Tax=Liquorilactobacillus satsumensis TaxID=259059 RepID=UPI0039E8E842